MQTIEKPLCALLIALASVTLGYAKPDMLCVKVSNLKHQPMPKVKVAAGWPGSYGSSGDTGMLAIPLPRGTRPGSWVELQLVNSPYDFVSPWNRRVQVPSSENDCVQIYIARRKDREVLESSTLYAAVVKGLQTASKPKERDGQVTEAQRNRVLAEYAHRFGFSPEELDSKLREWPKNTTDPLEKGMAAMYIQNYPEATAELTKAYGMGKGVLQQAQIEFVYTAYLLGQSLYNEGKYDEAVNVFREASKIKDTEPELACWLAASLHRVGNRNEAEHHYTRALSNWEEELAGKRPASGLGQRLSQGVKKVGRGIGSAVSYIFRGRAPSSRAQKFQPDIASAVNGLASLYHSDGKTDKIDPLYNHWLETTGKYLGKESSTVVALMKDYADLMRKMNREDEATKLITRANEIQKKTMPKK